MGIKRGWIYLADLDPRRGAEPGKTRPVLVVQTDLLNRHGHPSSVVLPLTTHTQDDADPLRVRIPADHPGFDAASDVMIDQIRAIDNRRLYRRRARKLIKSVAALQPELMRQVDTCFKALLDLTP